MLSQNQSETKLNMLKNIFDDYIKQSISKNEITKVIKCLKNRKSPDCDKIITEVIKGGGRCMVSMLHKIFNKILSKEVTPIHW